MQIQLYSENFPVDSKKFVEKTTIKDDGYEENIIRLNHPIAKGSFREIYFDELRIGIGELYLAQETALYFENNDKMVEMYFVIDAEIKIRSENLEKEMRFEPHEHNVIYYDKIRGDLICNAGAFRIVEIDMTPGFLEKYLSKEDLNSREFFNKIKSEQTASLFKENGYINLDMYSIITEISECERKGFYKKMFLEAKVIELLLLQMEQLSENSPIGFSIKPEDVEKLYIVREYILENLSSSISLIELAKIAGTNEFTLKKGFKEVFGTTVFGFWTDVKMEKAKKILKDPNVTIKEVAYEIGYKYPQHFTAAFKRKFGIVPSRIRK